MHLLRCRDSLLRMALAGKRAVTPTMHLEGLVKGRWGSGPLE